MEYGPMHETDRDTESTETAQAPEQAPGRADDERRSGDGQEQDAATRLAEAEAQAAEFRDQFLRTAAELENVRRRAARDVESAHRFGIERFARELLAVVDTLELGREAARGANESGAVVEGMEATTRQLLSVLEKFGVTPVEAAGEPFDPELHEAIMTQPSGEAAPDTVIGVVQQGYRIHDRLLRPARVIVARPPDA
jgi:molecular chaperone GrpE